MTIVALDLHARQAYLEDGTVLPITNLFDAAGDDTNDIEAAVAFVCGAGGLWLCDQVTNFQPETVH